VTLLGACFASKDYNSSPNIIESFRVNNFSEISNIFASNEFKMYVAKHSNIDMDNFSWELVNSDTDETNVIKFYYNSQKKIYFSLKTKKDISNKSGSIISVNNKFKIFNNAGRTTHDIGVTFYRIVSGFPVEGSSSTMYNLVNGGVLNYDPSPEITHVTFAINVEEKWPGDPRIDIYKLIIPLKGWHTASILKNNDGYYLKFT
jgi:hypothetical protein